LSIPVTARIRWHAARVATFVALTALLVAAFAPLTNGRRASASSGDFVETFDGDPLSPSAWHPANWDVTVHSRDTNTFGTLQTMQAMHGPTCAAPPATHAVSAYEDAVFQCNGHVMTAIFAAGYGVIYLTPSQLVDFASGEAVVRFDVSTNRSSLRDWIDLWITPFQDNLQLPLERFLPDLSGEPRNSVHLRMDNFCCNGTSGFRAILTRNFTSEYLPLLHPDTGYESFLTPSMTRRDTFELRLSNTHLRFGMPAYGFWWVDTDIAPLGWTQGVVQLGHHSYNPQKDCVVGPEITCQPNTWHWDNVSISPAVPFTLLRGDRRVVSAANATLPVRFPAGAPADAHLRFSAIGGNIAVSTDGGRTWQAAQRQAVVKPDQDEIFKQYWTPVPQGTASVLIRGADPSQGVWLARDISIWSLAAPAPAPVPSCRCGR
jgi:hypothetical protein